MADVSGQIKAEGPEALRTRVPWHNPGMMRHKTAILSQNKYYFPRSYVIPKNSAMH